MLEVPGLGAAGICRVGGPAGIRPWSIPRGWLGPPTRGGEKGLSELGVSLWDLAGGVPIVSYPRGWFPALVAQIGLQSPKPFVFVVTGSYLKWGVGGQGNQEIIGL